MRTQTNTQLMSTRYVMESEALRMVNTTQHWRSLEYSFIQERDGTVHTGVLETRLCRLEALYGLILLRVISVKF